MRLYASVTKSFKEMIRDWKVLSLVLIFAPFFVLIMKLFYGGEPTTYNIGIINLDNAAQSVELFQSMEDLQGNDNHKLLNIKYIKNLEELKKKVVDKAIDIGIVIPENYSETLLESVDKKADNPTVVDIYGSMGNTKYMVAAVLVNDLVYKQGMGTSEIVLPVGIRETFLEKKQAINEFDGYVPGLIALAVLMIMFTATAAIVKENDKNTLVRIKMSRLGAFHYLFGVSVVETAVAFVAMLLTYLTAILLGYKPLGSFWAISVVGIVSSLSMVAMSLIIACFMNTVFDVMTIGCFPLFIMMFFSGCMFPMPKVIMFTLAGKAFGITDILSLSFTSTAFNKILNYDVGIGGVAFEILMISLLTLIYFVVGMMLYQKKRLSRA